MKNLNVILQNLSRPFNAVFTKNLTFLVNKAGKITDVFKGGGSVYETVISYLKMHDNIFDVFAIDDNDLQKAAMTNISYPIRKNIEYHYEMAGDFYTDIPLLNLDIVQSDDNLFLGVIKRAEFSMPA
jgi:hypothetical protein